MHCRLFLLAESSKHDVEVMHQKPCLLRLDCSRELILDNGGYHLPTVRVKRKQLDDTISKGGERLSWRSGIILVLLGFLRVGWWVVSHMYTEYNTSLLLESSAPVTSLFYRALPWIMRSLV
jgi:hypothetical protein